MLHSHTCIHITTLTTSLKQSFNHNTYLRTTRAKSKSGSCPSSSETCTRTRATTKSAHEQPLEFR